MLIASAGLIAKEKNNPIQPKKIIANNIHLSIVYHQTPSALIFVLDILSIYSALLVREEIILIKKDPLSS